MGAFDWIAASGPRRRIASLSRGATCKERVPALNGSAAGGDLSKVTDEAILNKHPGVRRAQGHIGFLGHGSHVEFRNIRVKEL